MGEGLDSSGSDCAMSPVSVELQSSVPSASTPSSLGGGCAAIASSMSSSAYPQTCGTATSSPHGHSQRAVGVDGPQVLQSEGVCERAREWREEGRYNEAGREKDGHTAQR